MSTRKWLIRSLIPIFIGLLVGMGLYVSSWLKPAYIREQCIAQLLEKFQNVDIEVGSASLRFFGGISISDLKMTRKDDPDHKPILYIPYAVLQQDKERLSQGQLVIRKIDMDSPTIRLQRNVDGTLNWSNILLPPKDDEPIPVFVLKNAKVEIDDYSPASPRTLNLDIPKVVMVNDPKSIYRIEGFGSCELFGNFSFAGTYDEQQNGFHLKSSLKKLPIEPAQLNWLSAMFPRFRNTRRSCTAWATSIWNWPEPLGQL